MSLKSRSFRASDDGPRLLVTGGVHGDEFEPILAIRQLIERFTAENLLLRGQLTLIPLVNESAFRRGHRCAAEDNLDLARTCPGRSDGSYTERIAAALSEQIAAATHYLDLHTGGTEYAVAPLAGYNLVADAEILETQRRMARAFNLPLIWGTAANLEGRSLSVARDVKVPAIYAEYLGSATRSSEGVVAYVEGVLNVMAELGMIDRPPSPNRVERVVEDPRPGSGHMQVCHPAPFDGCFEPEVTLGEIVSQGQALGHILDLLGEEKKPVLAEESGQVIVLRTFPRVCKGDSVGVVLPLDSAL